MIYIFSNKSDTTTNQVMDWITYYGEDCRRINEEASEEVYLQLSRSLQNTTQIIDEHHQSKEKRNTFWFRRPDHRLMQRLVSQNMLHKEDVVFPEFPKDSTYWDSWQKDLQLYQVRYYNALLNDSETKIGNYEKTSLNKVEVLKQAKKLDIDIPDSIISNSKKEIAAFFDRHNKDIICKSLFEIVYPIGVNEAGFLLRGLTQAINDISTLPDDFFPSLFQENIAKKYELRIYYVNGEFYSTAMFTQRSDKTSQDFRNYDDEEPTRIVPYKMDQEQEDKLHLLMKALSLDNGSIDMIKGIDNKYYFLEINPVGQYGFISHPANYNIAKRNAEILIQKQYPQNIV